MKGFVVSVLSVLFVQSAWALSVPDQDKTPGAICTPQDPNFEKYDYPEHIARCKRNVDTQEKLQVAQEYGGIPESDWHLYEFDHLIPLCAGGADSIENIWPQPLTEAHEKDVLENDICDGMKAGTLSQAAAIQKVHDWFAARASALEEEN